MNRFQTFQQFLAAQTAEISVWGFMINLCLTAILAYLLGRIYIRYGSSLSNRRMFANNFALMAMTTMLIITIVKASLALSLGLVGALSIVRFRAAIKEPEELSYLFLTIGIGLGLGAGQRAVTLIGFCIICGMIVLRRRYHGAEISQNLYLTVASRNPASQTLGTIMQILEKYCSAVDMKRFDETKEVMEASFLIEFDGFEQLSSIKSELQKLHDSITISFLDHGGIR